MLIFSPAGILQKRYVNTGLGRTFSFFAPFHDVEQNELRREGFLNVVGGIWSSKMTCSPLSYVAVEVARVTVPCAPRPVFHLDVNTDHLCEMMFSAFHISF